METERAATFSRPGARLWATDPESAFTLIELLVVMFILGILAALALPIFLNQQQKAYDSNAKQMAHTAQVAMELCADEHAGTYVSCDAGTLKAIEPTLRSGPALATPVHAAKSYSLTVTAEVTGHEFSVERNANGEISFPCTPRDRGGCPGSASWAQG